MNTFIWLYAVTRTLARAEYRMFSLESSRVVTVIVLSTISTDDTSGNSDAENKIEAINREIKYIPNVFLRFKNKFDEYKNFILICEINVALTFLLLLIVCV